MVSRKVYGILIWSTALVLFFPMVLFAQETDQRVVQIKKWYQEAVTLQGKLKDKYCRQSKKLTKDEYGTYNQVFRDCDFTQGYTYTESDKNEWEYHSNTRVYYRDGNLFFIFMVYSNVCEEVEYRIYFDEAERPFRILEKYLISCDDEEEGKNNTVKDPQRKREILKSVKNQFDVWPSQRFPF